MTGNPVEIPVSTDVTTSLSSRTAGYLIQSYNTEPRELLITVSDGTTTEEYVIHVVRGSYLGGLSVKSAAGEIAFLYAFFCKDDVCVQSPCTVVHERTGAWLNRRGILSYAPDGQRRAGGKRNVPSCPVAGGSKSSFEIRDSEKNAIPYEYVLTVYVDEACYLTVNLEPETAVFALYDENGEQIDPVDGRYEVIKDASYTYTVSAPGYQSQSGSLIGGKEEKLEFRLKKSADNTLEELASEWGDWKTAENLNIVSAPTPSSANNTEILWKQKYGKNLDALGSLSDGILVEDYICYFYWKSAGVSEQRNRRN